MDDDRPTTIPGTEPAEPIGQGEVQTEVTEEVSATPDVNRETAEANMTEGDEIISCPKCQNPRRRFTIVDGQCDSCRSEGERAQIVPTLGWPEVRQRRLMLIVNSDHTQLEDREDSIKATFKDWRQALRDVTQLPDPFAAWYKLDELESSRPHE